MRKALVPHSEAAAVGVSHSLALDCEGFVRPVPAACRKKCAACGYPAAKIRSYEWSKKSKRRRAPGTGRMRQEAQDKCLTDIYKPCLALGRGRLRLIQSDRLRYTEQGPFFVHSQMGARTRLLPLYQAYMRPWQVRQARGPAIQERLPRGRCGTG